MAAETQDGETAIGSDRSSILGWVRQGAAWSSLCNLQLFLQRPDLSPTASSSVFDLLSPCFYSSVNLDLDWILVTFHPLLQHTCLHDGSQLLVFLNGASSRCNNSTTVVGQTLKPSSQLFFHCVPRCLHCFTIRPNVTSLGFSF